MMWFDAPLPVVSIADMADAEDMADIHALSFHRGWPSAEVEALLSQDSVIAVVARRANLIGGRRPVAFVMVRAGHDEAEVLTVAVHPKERGKGLGRLVMDEVMRRLYFNRVRSLFLEVDEGNAPALALYRRLGFKSVGQRPNYYASGGSVKTNALVMRADLT